MKILFILLTAVFSTAAMAQNTAVINDPHAEKRPLNASFTAISVSSGVELFLTQSANEELAVSYSDPKYAERFKTVVENGILKIYYDHSGLKGYSSNKMNLRAYVSFKTLEKLNASAGSYVKVSETINADNFNLKVSSGANFNGTVKAKAIDVDQSSGSHVSISGKTDNIKVHVSSGAKFNGYELSVDFCEAKASSGARVNISVEKELTADVSSGGDVRYKGAAVIRDIDISSGGTVKKA